MPLQDGMCWLMAVTSLQGQDKDLSWGELCRQKTSLVPSRVAVRELC